ncbi:hypothetical protein JKP88DRAFT_241888 [Tribonema minus]|uniref:Apple domain-containing protein n=1 Tax=Tribonema minus TaxID=303371 RepID=A0A835YXQ5_9STRA|nr:hypothetical protein JKP88DRAFT_241888 [Tribonema minus]
MIWATTILSLAAARTAVAADLAWIASTTTYGTGDWSNASNWKPAAIPSAGDHVWIDAGVNGTVALNADVTLAGLNLASGTLNLTSSASITVTGVFNFSGGTLSATHAGSALRIQAGAAMHVLSMDEKILQDVLLALEGSADWSSGGDLLLHGAASISIGSAATLSIGSAGGSSSALRAASPWHYFNCTPNAKLNQEAILEYALAPSDPAYDALALLYGLPLLPAVFDRVSAVGAVSPRHLSSNMTDGTTDSYKLSAMLDAPSRELFNNSGFASTHTTYASVTTGGSVEDCASACWSDPLCQGFDFEPGNQICSRSALQMGRAGGLQDSSADPIPSTHCERLDSARDSTQLGVITVAPGGAITVLAGSDLEVDVPLSAAQGARLVLSADASLSITMGGALTLVELPSSSGDTAAVLISGAALDITAVTGSGTVSYAGGAGHGFPARAAGDDLTLSVGGALGVIVEGGDAATPACVLDLGDGTLAVTGNATVQLSTLEVRAAAVVLADAAVLRASVLQLDVAGAVTVERDALLDLTGGGDPAETGAGAGVRGTLGGSGGGFGGSGGNGYDQNTVGLCHGDDFRSPALVVGSGGGSTALYEKGGAGGGALVLSADSLQLDGRVAADGKSGGVGGGGGGSGGSIVINVTSTLSGAGTLSTNGGAGGVGGGLLVGGGGGGGRVAITCSGGLEGATAAGFTGTVAAQGGSQVTSTAEYTPVLAAAGTVYWMDADAGAGAVNNGILVVDNGGQVSGGAGTCLAAGAAALAVAAADIRNGARLAIDGAGLSFTVTSPPTGDGNGILAVTNNGTLSLPSALELRNLTVSVEAGGVLSGGESTLEIGSGGVLSLSDLGYANGAISAGSYMYDAVLVVDGGMLEFKSTMATSTANLTASTVTLHAGSLVRLTPSDAAHSALAVAISAAEVTSTGAQWQSTGVSSPANVVVSVTSSSAPAALSAGTTLSALTLEVAGAAGALWDGGDVTLLDAAVLRIAPNSAIYIGTTAGTISGAGAAAGSVDVHGALLQPSSTSNATVEVPVVLQPAAGLTLAGALRLVGGGSVGAGATVTVNAGGALDLAGGNFNFDTLSAVTGAGTIKWTAEATSNLPSTVSDGAPLLLLDGGTVTLTDGPYSLVAMTTSSGTLSIAAGVRIQVETLTASGATITLLAATSQLTISDAMSWSAGTIQGPGTLTIGSSAQLIITDGRAAPLTLSDFVRVDCTGTAQWLSGAVTSQQGSAFAVAAGATFAASAAAAWAPGAAVSSFTVTRDAVLTGGSDQPPLAAATGLSLEQCSAWCLAGGLEAAAPVGYGLAVNADAPCLSFQYEVSGGNCVLLAVNSPTFGAILSAAAPSDPAYSYYELVSVYITPAFTNHGDVVVSTSGLTAAAPSFAVSFYNNGTLTVDAAQSLVLTGGGSSTAAAHFNIAVGAALTFGGAASSDGYTFNATTALSGDGLIVLAAAASAHELPALIAASGLTVSATSGAQASCLSAAAATIDWALKSLLIDAATLSLASAAALTTAATLTLTSSAAVMASTDLSVTVGGAASLSGGASLSTAAAGAALNLTAASLDVQAAGTAISAAVATVTATDIAIGTGAAVTCSGGGTAIAGAGTGSSYWGAGGGYGGTGGGTGGGTCYGSVVEPAAFTGSAGGSSGTAAGGAGGGALTIVADTLALGGTVSCDGADGSSSGSGGGSGGGVAISIGTTMTGTGQISATGGSATSSGGGGGGGRIYISAPPNTPFLPVTGGLIGSGTGSVSVAGGGGSTAVLNGGSGTLLVEDASTQGQRLLVHNGGLAAYPTAATMLKLSAGASGLASTLSEVVVEGGAYLSFKGPGSIAITSELTADRCLPLLTTATGNSPTQHRREQYFKLRHSPTMFIACGDSVLSTAGDATGSVTATDAARITLPSPFALGPVTLALTGGAAIANTLALSVTAGAALNLTETGAVGLSAAAGSYTFSTLDVGGGVAFAAAAGAPAVVLQVEGDLTVAAAGKVHADATGYGGAAPVALGGAAAGAGPGGGASGAGGASGGSHGGYGAQGFATTGTVGNPYGDVMAPSAWGSGGGASQSHVGGAGGGAVKVIVGGAMACNGVLSADGHAARGPGAGGGAGGSISLTVAGTLTGSGKIRAVGGAGSAFSGGWGGAGSGGRIAITSANAASLPLTEVSAAGGGQTYSALGDSAPVQNSNREDVLKFLSGGGDAPAGPGTVFLHDTSAASQALVVDNTPPSGAASLTQFTPMKTMVSLSGAAGSHTAAWVGAQTLSLSTVTLRGGGALMLSACSVSLAAFSANCDGSADILVSTGSVLTPQGGALSLPAGARLAVLSGGQISAVTSVTVGASGALTLGAASRTAGAAAAAYAFASLTVASGGSVTTVDDAGSGGAIVITAASVDVQAGGVISADGGGYAGGAAGGRVLAQGPLAGASKYDAGYGGGHVGGLSAYGDPLFPARGGSGGGGTARAAGGAGGGALHITADALHAAGSATLSTVASMAVTSVTAGDGTGVVTVLSGATLSAQPAGADLVIDNVTLEVEDGGALAGWGALIVRAGGVLQLSSTSIGTGPGAFDFTTVSVAAGGIIRVVASAAATTSTATAVTLRAGSINVAAGGLITGVGTGGASTSRTAVAAASAGSAAVGADGGGGGGGHAGSGGSGYGAEYGAHNAVGGSWHGAAFGPQHIGGGGGAGAFGDGGPGGAAVKLVTTGGGDITIDGIIDMSGAPAATATGGGGGAGGSIWLSAGGALRGSGALTANGGSGDWAAPLAAGGGGSGGRIACVGSTDPWGASDNALSVSARGGAQAALGLSAAATAAAGAAWLPAAAAAAQAAAPGAAVVGQAAAGSVAYGTTAGVWSRLVVAGAGAAAGASAAAMLACAVPDVAAAVDVIEVTLAQVAIVSAGAVLTASAVTANALIGAAGSVTVAAGAALAVPDGFIASAAVGIAIEGTLTAAGSVLLVGATLSIDSSTAQLAIAGALTLSNGAKVTGANINIAVPNLNLCATCTIDASYLGYQGGTAGVVGDAAGPGAGAFGLQGGSGGGHGGLGIPSASALAQQRFEAWPYDDAAAVVANSMGNIANGGAAYGSASTPTTAGSGGGAGAASDAGGGGGGGVVTLVIGDAFQLDGQVLALGQSGGGGGGGGGAGGSIHVTCDALRGAGTLLADGGLGAGSSADGSGSGGGGRVALAAADASAFTGAMRARSGAAAHSATALLELATAPAYQGSVYRAGDALISSVVAADGGGAPGYGAGDTIAVHYSRAQQLPVQVITSSGTGSGARGAAAAADAVIRGSWRVGYAFARWSPALSTQASAADVQAALLALDGAVAGAAIAVTRAAGADGAGWQWSVTFADVGVSAPPLRLRVDASRAYTTDANAAFSVAYAADAGVAAEVPAAAVLSAWLLPGQAIGAAHTAAWASPSTLLITVTNVTGAAPPVVGTFAVEAAGGAAIPTVDGTSTLMATAASILDRLPANSGDSTSVMGGQHCARPQPQQPLPRCQATASTTVAGHGQYCMLHRLQTTCCGDAYTRMPSLQFYQGQRRCRQQQRRQPNASRITGRAQKLTCS